MWIYWIAQQASLSISILQAKNYDNYVSMCFKNQNKMNLKILTTEYTEKHSDLLYFSVALRALRGEFFF